MPEVGGVSFHRVAGWTRLPYDKEGRYVLSPELEEAIRQLRLPMTRFYALGDEPFGLEAAIDKAAEFCADRRPGSHAAGVRDPGGYSGSSPRPGPAALSTVGQGYAFRHWEITNEPYVGRPGRAFSSAERPGTFPRGQPVIREVQPPDARRHADPPRSPAWGNYLLRRATGHYDFVVGHYYRFANVYRSSFEDVVLTANYRVLDEILKVNALLCL